MGNFPAKKHLIAHGQTSIKIERSHCEDRKKSYHSKPLARIDQNLLYHAYLVFLGACKLMVTRFNSAINREGGRGEKPVPSVIGAILLASSWEKLRIYTRLTPRDNIYRPSRRVLTNLLCLVCFFFKYCLGLNALLDIVIRSKQVMRDALDPLRGGVAGS